MTDIDFTGADVLRKLGDDLSAAAGRVVLTDLSEEAVDTLRKTDATDAVIVLPHLEDASTPLPPVRPPRLRLAALSPARPPSPEPGLRRVSPDRGSSPATAGWPPQEWSSGPRDGRSLTRAARSRWYDPLARSPPSTGHGSRRGSRLARRRPG